MSKFITIAELSKLLGKSENSLRYHLKQGRIKPTIKLGRSMLFDPEQVIKQLQRSIS
ncbi:helix-turn-helix domain-containing protein [Bdellovibrio sp. HCB290]|uniref:helix-turn-helix domain-containing protein n=1 Tax=Bdellovibrio sp. HCB290 TaxID=3394356 RepID=UPI0039B41410